MNETSTIFMHAECSNIHLLLHVGTILVQYSGDDVIGEASIHVLLYSCISYRIVVLCWAKCHAWIEKGT